MGSRELPEEPGLGSVGIGRERAGERLLVLNLGAAPQPPAMQGVPLTARTKDGEGVHLLTGKTQKLKGVCLVKKFLLSGRESLKQDPETPHECRATHDA